MTAREPLGRRGRPAPDPARGRGARWPSGTAVRRSASGASPWWAMRGRAGRRPGPPGRHQLRQRLQRRRAGHRRRRGSGRSASWRRAWRRAAAVKRAALVAFGVAAAGRAGPRRWPRAGSCSLVGAAWHRRRAGSTPAGRSPTATSASARCSCSCSSGSSPRSARRYVQVERDHRAGGRAPPSPSGCWPPPCWWSTTCATSRPTGRGQEDAGRAPRREARPGGLRGAGGRSDVGGGPGRARPAAGTAGGRRRPVRHGAPAGGGRGDRGRQLVACSAPPDAGNWRSARCTPSASGSVVGPP